MNKLGWYVRRLATMDPAEVGWRVVATARTAVDGVLPAPSDDRLLAGASPNWSTALESFVRGEGRPVLLDRARAAEVASAHPAEMREVIAAADRAVAGRFRFFGYPEVTLGSAIDWNHDPLSVTTWPSIASTRIDHRSAAGDAKWIWELNRLQHLPWLAQAWLVTGDDRYADTAWQHLDSWIAQNPPGSGIAWRGAFEAGIRAVSVAVALQGLRDSEGLTLERFMAVARMLAESARRCWRDRSRFSSANNHLVGELTGLAVVSLLLPELAGSADGLRRALVALTEEAEQQILPDGAGAEQAFAYQIFTSDLLLVVAALLRLAGRPVPSPITAALERGAAFLGAVVGENDPVGRYGDDDEGFALRLDPAEVPDVRSHLACFAAVAGDPVAARLGREGMSSHWLGGAVPESVSAPGRTEAGSIHATVGGLVVLRSGRRRTMMDVGPLGYLSIAAHGHADALAVTLANDGADLVGDPGPASYYGHPDWRRTHRSTRVHATVEVDGVDQSVDGGSFLWTRHAGVTVHRVDVRAGLVDAEHNGYCRLAEPVRHRRWLIAPPESTSVLVADLLTGAGRHDARTSWPLHPDLELVSADADGHLALRNGVDALRVVHAATVPLVREEVRGDVLTGLGWWSDRLESRKPAWLIGARVSGAMPVAVVTLLQTGGSDRPEVSDLAVKRIGERLEIVWAEGRSRHSVIVRTARPGDVSCDGVQM